MTTEPTDPIALSILDSLRTQIARHGFNLGQALFTGTPAEGSVKARELDKILIDCANNAAQGLMELGELAEAAIAWARAEAEADRLIDCSIDLARLRVSFLERAEPVGPSLAKNEAQKIGREIDALDEKIAAACETVTQCEATWKYLAKNLAKDAPSARERLVMCPRCEQMSPPTHVSAGACDTRGATS
jgi:ssDNA-binding Zn-finger/Zn-ribbon topoisomerase 1